MILLLTFLSFLGKWLWAVKKNGIINAKVCKGFERDAIDSFQARFMEDKKETNISYTFGGRMFEYPFISLYYIANCRIRIKENVWQTKEDKGYTSKDALFYLVARVLDQFFFSTGRWARRGIPIKFTLIKYVVRRLRLINSETYPNKKLQQMANLAIAKLCVSCMYK